MILDSFLYVLSFIFFVLHAVSLHMLNVQRSRVEEELPAVVLEGRPKRPLHQRTILVPPPPPAPAALRRPQGSHSGAWRTDSGGSAARQLLHGKIPPMSPDGFAPQTIIYSTL